MTHNTSPSQNTRAQKRKLEEILTETPDDDEFDDQLLCFELMTSLNSDEDVVKVMGADVPLAVQIQAFPELAGLFKMERKATQDWKDWKEALALKAEREREREIERVRNELIILNRFYPTGGIVAAHPARVLYYQHDPTRYHPIGAATVQYLPRSPIEPIPSGLNIRINRNPQARTMVDSRFDMNLPTPESTPEPEDVKGKGVAGRPSKRTKFNKYRF